jgi:FAD synthetase
MTQDLSTNSDGARVNGVPKATSAATADAPCTLPETCDELRRRVMAFLEEEADSEMLRGVQSQVKVSMAVIDEALRRYGYVCLG